MKDAPSTYIRQGDARWRSVLLGDGSATIGGAGCLLCCLREAECIYLPSTTRDPRPLNVAGKEAGAFVSSGAIIDKLAVCAGLVCGPRVAGDTAVLRTTILDAVRANALVLMHVDHDSRRAKGDTAADHWVLAVDADDHVITYADPATGEPATLPLDTLIGPSSWPDRRVFAVRACRVLSLP